MSTHSRHKNENGTILYDDCPRCSEHVEKLGLELDHELYIKMWNRMLAVNLSRGSRIQTEYHSHNEMILGNYLYRIAIALRMHTNIDIKDMPWQT